MFNRVLKAAVAAVTISALHISVAHAQLEQLSPEDRIKALKALQGERAETSDAPPPVLAAPVRAPSLSPKEVQQVQSGDEQLPLFGYALFAGSNDFSPSAEVPVPQNYVLGPGDIVRVQLFGNQNETLNLSVTRDGSINFPKLGPVQVAGLSVDDARAVIDRRVSKELIGVQTNITLGPLRGVQVFLLGDARQPGAYSVSGLATITNALIAGGGVATTGSLRKIELKRGGRVVQRIDLYDFLLRGDSSRDVRIQAGDAVFIPAAGARIAVAGAVTRPAVYEITGPITIRAALDMAGGLVGNARRAQVSLERIDNKGQRQLRAIDLSDSAALATTLRDGDRIEIGAVYARADNPVSVFGYVRYEKQVPWSTDLTLRGVLSLAEVRPSEPGRELYPVMGLIERTELATGLRSWRGFDLFAVMSGERDEPVEALDRVLVLTRSDIAYLLSPEVRNALQGKLPVAVAELDTAETSTERLSSKATTEVGDPLRRKTEEESKAVMDRSSTASAPVCPALLEVVKISDSARATGIQILLDAQANAEERRSGQARAALTKAALSPAAPVNCPTVFRQAPTALPYLLEHSAGLVGELRHPGLYPFVPGTLLGRLTAIAGGETAEADQNAVEFFNANEALQGGSPQFRRLPRDAAFGQQPAMSAIYKFLPAAALPEVGAVNIRGEVRFPGRYVIARGERYSDLMARAGGLSENAFAYGTVFTRESARTLETGANRRAASELRESLFNATALGASAGATNGGGGANTVVLDLVQRLENTPAIGRVVIEADPAVLSSRPGGDFLLEPGDEIYVPKRPNAVSVAGQVLNPGSLAFVSGARPEDYIRQSGGYSEGADESRAYLVLPNGVARPMQQSFWRYRQEAIPPGSVIVVPRDVAPYTGLLLTERISSIIANLALSAAALVTINR